MNRDSQTPMTNDQIRRNDSEDSQSAPFALGIQPGHGFAERERFVPIKSQSFGHDSRP